jgi:excisionase family DNA binding protein
VATISARRGNPDWVGLSEASRLLGVSPATVRRWSDAGRLRVFTTPGGHRRFSRRTLERLLPSEALARPSLTSAGLTSARVVRSYRRAGRSVVTDLPWVLRLSDQQRALFRERGKLLAEGLLRYLDASGELAAESHLGQAAVDATEYGRVAADLGLSLSQTVEGFLRFRAPFLHELALAARRRGFETDQTTELLETAERGMDRLLVSTMTGHGQAAVEGKRRQRHWARALAPSGADT